MVYALFSILPISVFYFHHDTHKSQHNRFYKIIVVGCLFSSWTLIAMWFTAIIESWQISGSIPASASLPSGLLLVRQALHFIFNTLPIRRLYLGIIYALPALAIPFISKKHSDKALTIYLRAAILNVIFFWTQVSVEWLAHKSSSITGDITQTLVLLLTYFLLLYLLWWPTKQPA